MEDEKPEVKTENRLEPKEKPAEVKAPKEQVVYRIFGESMSESIGSLAGAMAKAQGACNNGSKEKQGYGYKYQELGSVIDIARKPLSENSLCVLQTHELVKGGSASVVTHTTIMHESGEWFKSSIELPIKAMPQLSASQCIGVNCTYGRRYALQSLLLISAETDTDGS